MVTGYRFFERTTEPHRLDTTTAAYRGNLKTTTTTLRGDLEDTTTTYRGDITSGAKDPSAGRYFLSGQKKGFLLILDPKGEGIGQLR